MKPPISPTTAIQPDLFRVLLCTIISPTHPMVKLADSIHWDVFERRLEPCFSDTGRQAKPVRLMVGLMYLKHTFNLSACGFNLRKLLRAFSFFVQFAVWMALFRGIVPGKQDSRQRNLVPHLL